MGAWMLPSAAAAFALGLLCGGSMPGWVEPRIAFAVGLLALGSAWFVAGRERRGPGPLVRANLLPPDHAVIEAVEGRRVSSAVAPAVAAALSLAGVLALGTGWSGFHDRGLDYALLATLAPERVVLEATLKTDPRKTSLGWSATAQVSRVEWSDGVATLRSSVWVSGSEGTPHARRGDRVLLEGALRVPDDPGFADALRHKGIPAQLQL